MINLPLVLQDGRVVSNFLVQALRGDPITLYGDGLQTRSFCYVADLVEGLVRLMENNQTIGPMNLGNPNEFSMVELAEVVRARANPSLGFEHRTLPRDDPKRRRPDCSLAESVLDWVPVVQLEDGISRTFDDFKQRAEKNPEMLFTQHQKEAQIVIPPPSTFGAGADQSMA